MKQDLISIIVPVYGVEKYLNACVDSILAQTHKNLEVILIDDGSPDSCGAICDAYALRDTRVRVIHQTNAGAANAKNTGLDTARGDYIAFADSDDWVEPDWIEKMLQAAQTQDAQVVECNFYMSYTDGEEYGNVPASFGEELFTTQEYLRRYLTRWTCALFWNKLFRASLLKEVRFHTKRRCVDDEFFTYKAVTAAERVLRISDALYHYRQRSSSVTQTEKTLYQRTVDGIDILAERHQWMKAHYPAIAMDYLRHDVDTLLYYADNYLFNKVAIDRFRAASQYYFRECLRYFPGRVTCYYAVKILLRKKKNFRTIPNKASMERNIDRYYP